MKKTNSINCEIASSIEKKTNFSFENQEFKLDDWGYVDNYGTVKMNEYVFLECEDSQKHPSTNVLKLYPYLEDNFEVSVTLIHFFFKRNKAPKNRIALCNFIAMKMQEQFGERFNYQQIIET